MASCSIFLIVSILVSTITSAINCHNQIPKPPRFKALFTFGDAFVDSGNNNFIPTLIKANHAPYGRVFPGQVATGRFSDGKLISDFIASELGLKDNIPPFLQPNLSNQELSTGVSFASAGSGFDDLTTAVTNTIPIAKQTEHFTAYFVKLRAAVGDALARDIIGQSLVFIVAGSDDFYVNYYTAPTRHLHLGLQGYQDFLHHKIHLLVKALYELGCRSFLIAGLPPVGCKPLEITKKLRLDRTCVSDENRDAESYNQKLIGLLPQIQAAFQGAKIVYADLYTPMVDMINNPRKYGFVTTNIGCCGTGLLEAGLLCKPFSLVCPNPTQFLFWDSVNPTECANRHIAQFLNITAIPQFY